MGNVSKRVGSSCFFIHTPNVCDLSCQHNEQTQHSVAGKSTAIACAYPHTHHTHRWFANREELPSQRSANHPPAYESCPWITRRSWIAGRNEREEGNVTNSNTSGWSSRWLSTSMAALDQAPTIGP